MPILILVARYRGHSEIEGGLLLDKANCGDLQSYFDGDNKVNNALRRKWSLQIAEAVAYVHEKGVIHSNLSTRNVLVHQTGETTDLILADFGGSRCLELDLNGMLIPDQPFLDPQLSEFTSPKVDVFSLGIIIYIIMTGYYPFHQGPAPQNQERWTYSDRVRTLFKQGHFPDLSSVLFGGVIARCCCERRFETAKDVVVALEAEMQGYASQVSRLAIVAFIPKLTGQLRNPSEPINELSSPDPIPYSMRSPLLAIAGSAALDVVCTGCLAEVSEDRRTHELMNSL